MSKPYFVIDSAINYTSIDTETDEAELFANESDAIARASEMAADEVGNTFYVVTPIKAVKASPAKVKVTSVK